MSKTDDKIMIGSEEWLALPQLGIPAIKARVDSGAKTSSIHAFNIQPFRRNRKAWVSFEVHPIQKVRDTVVRCEMPVVDKRSVKSSSGIAEPRYVVSTLLKAGKSEWEIELTLANRDSMGYRMLLGREAMIGRAIVDPALGFCLGQISGSGVQELYGDAQARADGLRIALLASELKGYSQQRLLEAGEERGHEMLPVKLRQCYLKLDTAKPEVCQPGGVSLAGLDAVVTSIRPADQHYGSAVARQFESLQIPVINGSEAFSRALDQLACLQILLRHGVEIPRSGFSRYPVHAAELIDLVQGAPLLVKLLDARHMPDTVLLENRQQAESIVDALQSVQPRFLVQAVNREPDSRLLRCLLIANKVVVTLEYPTGPADLQPAAASSAAPVVVRISRQERTLVVRAVKALGLDVATVELIRSASSAMVLDVTPFPDLEDYEAASGKDIAGMLIAAVEKRLGWKRQVAVAL